MGGGKKAGEFQGNRFISHTDTHQVDFRGILHAQPKKGQVSSRVYLPSQQPEKVHILRLLAMLSFLWVVGNTPFGAVHTALRRMAREPQSTKFVHLTYHVRPLRRSHIHTLHQTSNSRRWTRSSSVLARVMWGGKNLQNQVVGLRMPRR